MGKIIGRNVEDIKDIQKRRQMAVDLFKSGYTLEEYRAGVQETITTKDLQKAVDPRKVRQIISDGKRYDDIIDMIAGR